MKNLNALTIIEQLRRDKNILESTFGVTKIGLFGSYVNGQINPDSDIDLLVEFKQASFDSLAGLYLYLEKKFDRKIEIIRKSKHLNPRFLNRVEKEVIYV